MSRKKISTTMYLDEAQLVALKALTISTGAPMAYIVRRALNEFIERQVASGAIDRDAIENIAISQQAIETARSGRLNRQDLDEATVERVLRRLLADRGSDA